MSANAAPTIAVLGCGLCERALRANVEERDDKHNGERGLTERDPGRCLARGARRWFPSTAQEGRGVGVRTPPPTQRPCTGGAKGTRGRGSGTLSRSALLSSTCAEWAGWAGLLREVTVKGGIVERSPAHGLAGQTVSYAVTHVPGSQASSHRV